MEMYMFSAKYLVGLVKQINNMNIYVPDVNITNH